MMNAVANKTNEFEREGAPMRDLHSLYQMLDDDGKRIIGQKIVLLTIEKQDLL